MCLTFQLGIERVYKYFSAAVSGKGAGNKYSEPRNHRTNLTMISYDKEIEKK